MKTKPPPHAASEHASNSTIQTRSSTSRISNLSGKIVKPIAVRASPTTKQHASSTAVHKLDLDEPGVDRFSLIAKYFASIPTTRRFNSPFSLVPPTASPESSLCKNFRKAVNLKPAAIESVSPPTVGDMGFEPLTATSTITMETRSMAKFLEKHHFPHMPTGRYRPSIDVLKMVTADVVTKTATTNDESKSLATDADSGCYSDFQSNSSSCHTNYRYQHSYNTRYIHNHHSAPGGRPNCDLKADILDRMDLNLIEND
jgi:hypothetical protein